MLEKSQQYLKDIFTKNYQTQENTIFVDFTQIYLEVIFEEDEEGYKRELPYVPLFKEIYLNGPVINDIPAELPGARILSFHSYKGGVGRTLSLISLLRECTAVYPDKKILVIDADIEAPGLTWILEDRVYGAVSYLDILSVMNFDENPDDMIDKLAELIKTSTVPVITDRIKREQFFIPVYRDKKQVMDIFSSPERILTTKDNKFFIFRKSSDFH